MHTRRVACLIFCTIPFWPRHCRESQRGNARSLATGWLDVKPAARDWEEGGKKNKRGNLRKHSKKKIQQKDSSSKKEIIEWGWSWLLNTENSSSVPTSAGSSCLYRVTAVTAGSPSHWPGVSVILSHLVAAWRKSTTHMCIPSWYKRNLEFCLNW